MGGSYNPTEDSFQWGNNKTMGSWVPWDQSYPDSRFPVTKVLGYNVNGVKLRTQFQTIPTRYICEVNSTQLLPQTTPRTTTARLKTTSKFTTTFKPSRKTTIPFHLSTRKPAFSTITTPPQKIDCPVPTDVAILLEDSSSLTSPRAFNTSLHFSAQLAFSLLANSKTRLLFIRFSDTACSIIGFKNNSQQSPENICKIILESHPSSKKPLVTYTHSALRLASEQFQKFSRFNVSKVLLLVTDKQSYFPEMTTSESVHLREMNVSTFAIGVLKGSKNITKSLGLLFEKMCFKLTVL